MVPLKAQVLAHTRTHTHTHKTAKFRLVKHINQTNYGLAFKPV